MSQLDFNKEYARAQQRTRARREIAKSVASLAPEDARMVLLDVYLDVAPIERAPTKAPSNARRVMRGRPSVVAPQILALLGERPRMPIADLAKAVHGTDGKYDQKRVRAVLTVLRVNGQVRNPATNAWELTPAGAAVVAKRAARNPPLRYRILPTNNPYVHDETLPPQDGAEWTGNAAARAAVASPEPLQ